MPNRKAPYSGPFAGLNTTARPRDLGPAWAVDAQNVLLYDGKIRPVWPFTPYGPSDTPWVNKRVISAYHWDAPLVGQVVIYQILSVGPGGQTAGTLYRADPSGGIVHLGGLLDDRPACYAPAFGQVYVLTGRVHKTDGTPEGTLLAGIPAPLFTADDLELQDAAAGFASLPEGVYQYAVSLYDRNRDVESNAAVIDKLLTVPQDGLFRAKISTANTSASPGRGVTDWRVYRRNVHLDQPFFLLRSTKSFAVVDRNLYDPYGTDVDPNPAEGSEVTGPFAPSKNGLPPFATVATLYKDRMFYGSYGVEESDQVYYSGFGHPDHVDPDDFETLAGDEERGVTGIKDYVGQLVILKPKSIWILSGAISGSTNETIATGAVPPESTHQVYRTKCQVGCANRGGGNGAVVVGDPPRIHYDADGGLYAFDGINEINVAEAIRPTWRKFARHGDPLQSEKHAAVTYAIDTMHEILFICNGIQRDFTDPEILCYHYGRKHTAGGQRSGAWTYLRSVSRTQPYRCVASTLGDIIPPAVRTDAEFYSGLLIGTAQGRLLLANDRDTEQRTPMFVYETPPLRIGEGGLFHIYQVTWLHDRVDDPSRRPRSFEIGYRSDRLNGFELDLRTMRDGIHQHQRVGRETAELALRIQSPAALDMRTWWHPDLGIVGWLIEYEPAGGD